MELWILLAAAGSGYFAQCCRKSSQTRREQSANKDKYHNNLESSGNSHTSSMSKRRHHKLSSSSRRKDRKSKRKPEADLHVSRDSRISVDGEHKTVKGGNLNGRDACFPNSYPVNTNLNTQQCTYCSRVSQEVNNVNSPVVRGRSIHSYRNPFYSSMHGFDSVQDGRTKLGSIVYPPLEGNGNNFIENKATYNLMDHIAFSDAQLLGFWDAPKSGFIRDGKNFDRKDVERITKEKMSSLSYTERIFKGESPISALDICISTELDEPDLESALNSKDISKQPKDPFNELFSDGNFESVDPEDALSTNQSECCYKMHFLPQALNSESREDINIEKGSSDRSLISNEGNSYKLSESVLFYFGVGVGIIFAVLSGRRRIKELSALIKESDILLKDLDCELGGGKNSSCDFFYTKDFSQDALTEKRDFNDMLKKLRKVIDMLDAVKGYLSHDLGSDAISSTAHSIKMAKLEAELEAEFERMEINFSNHESCCQCSTLNEVDSRLVQGEIGRDLKAEHYSDSSAEACHFGVSPVELERCLHEVLEARQEEYILELESELKVMHNRLQAKEDEVLLWKEKCLSLVAGKECEMTSNNNPEDDAILTPRSHCSPDSPVFESKRNLFNLASKHNVFQNALLSQNGQNTKDGTTYIALEGEALAAYNEAYDEFLKGSVNADKVSENATLESTSQTWTRISPYADIASAGSNEGSSHHLNTGSHDSSLSVGVVGSVKSDIRMERCNEIIGDFDNHDYFDAKNIHTQDMHITTIEHYNTDEKTKIEDSRIRKPFHFDWCRRDLSSHTGSRSSDHSQDVIAENHGRSGSAVEWSMSEDSCYSSDWDEQVGKILIGQIVEKSRRSSSIIEVAQSMLASFESDESPLSSD